MRAVILGILLNCMSVIVVHQEALSEQTTPFLLESGKCTEFWKSPSGAIFVNLGGCFGQSAFRLENSRISKEDYILTSNGNCLYYNNQQLLLSQCRNWHYQWRRAKADSGFMLHNNDAHACLTRKKPLSSKEIEIVMEKCSPQQLTQQWMIGAPG
ncbi:hypothetical protein [Rhizobium sp. SGZ-381]|uniref:hypothetical protein n=1 Tax=Rhizobium sp. SGZ-381 TaxID=3342800 RepID=UPI003671B6F2